MPTRRRAWFAICFALALVGCLALPALPTLGAQTQAGCAEWIPNGGFESATTGWTFGAAPARPQRVNSIVHTGQWSLLLGIPQGYPNQRSYSSAQRQVWLPADASAAILSFWYLSTMPAAPNTDYVELALLAPDGHTVIDKPWRGFVDNRVWNQADFDLSGWLGQSVILYFNVFNDGLSSTASMFMDDISLQVCGSSVAPGSPTATATGVSATSTPTILPVATTAAPGTRTSTPTVLPAATATPFTPPPTFTPVSGGARSGGPPVQPVPVASDSAPPSAQPLTALPVAAAISAPLTPPAPDCDDLVQNGGFESDLVYDGWYQSYQDHAWHTAPNNIPAGRETTDVFAGSYALQLGTLNPAGLASYSSVRQLVTIPAGYSQIVLQFATWTYAMPPSGSDRMEADFLEPDPAVLNKFWRVLLNEQYWVVREFDVSNYRGRSVLLYFNVYNDGASGPAAMLLDEVHIWGCQTIVPIVPVSTPGGIVLGRGGGRAPAQAAAPAPPVTPAPGMTVLAISSNTPEPPRGTSAPLATSAPQPTPTPAPQPNLLTRIWQALHLPPLPAYWPLGLLAILAVIIALLAYIRSQP